MYMTDVCILSTKVQILTRCLENQKREYTDLLLQRQCEYASQCRRDWDAHSQTVSELQRKYEHERARAQALEKQNTQLTAEKDQLTAHLQKKQALVKLLKGQCSDLALSSEHNSITVGTLYISCSG